MDSRILAVLNQKGGVGKTTTCCNLAYAFSRMEKKVLVIDLDPQSHLSTSLGLTDPGLIGVDSLFFDQAKAVDMLKNVRENLQVLPAGYRLSEIEKLSSKGHQQVQVIKKAIEPIQNDFDIVMMDCPPTSGLLNFCALYATQEVIIPVSSDYLAMHGLSQFIKTLKSAEGYMKKSLKVWIALTRYVTRRRLSQQVKNKLLDYFPKQVLATPVRECAPVAECPGFGQSIFEYNPTSNGALDYQALAEDILYQRVMQN